MLVLPAATRAGVECGDRQSGQYSIPTATASRPRDTWATLDSLLTILADELLVQDNTEPRAVPGSLSDDELHILMMHFGVAVVRTLHTIAPISKSTACLGLVRHMRGAVRHVGNPRIRVVRVFPICIGCALGPLAVQLG
jgi:hypothetical protein